MIRAGVVGVGDMGVNHARVYAQLPHVELVGVADSSAPRVQSVARTYGTRAYTDFRAMLDKERPQLISIAVPTVMHRDVACEAAARGIHILVEKPIAANESEAQTVIDAAKIHGVQLAVGHIERFNPAVIKLKERLEQGALGRVFMIHSRRLSPYPARILDVGVANDLATHELDIMRFLAAAEPVRVYAEINQVIHPSHEDIVFGVLKFENGVLGILDVNWVTPTKTRELCITGEKGMFLANYLTQELYFYENAFEQTSDAGGWEPGQTFSVNEGDMTRLRIVRQEPLKAEIEAFIRCVQTGEPPRVSGEDGLAALALAQRLVACGRAGMVAERTPSGVF